jgi:hypothetical protein
MITLCIHAFPTDQCASCRTCPHGLSTYKCARCRAATTAARRRRIQPASPRDRTTETHNGFEIFYVPAVNGWQYRAPDSTASAESFRSVFLARKAIDHLATAPTESGAKRKR